MSGFFEPPANCGAPSKWGAPAIIYVDGEEFIVLQDGDEFHKTFEETVEKIGGEVSLCVYKKRYDMYLRERLSITAPKEQK